MATSGSRSFGGGIGAFSKGDEARFAKATADKLITDGFAVVV